MTLNLNAEHKSAYVEDGSVLVVSRKGRVLFGLSHQRYVSFVWCDVLHTGVEHAQSCAYEFS